MDYQENTLTYEAYCGLRQSAGWAEAHPEQARRALQSSLCTVTAVADGQTIAMGRLIGDGLYFTIADVVVHPDWQGRGVGAEIVQRLVGYAQRQTPEGGRSGVHLVAAAGKEAFYEKQGFERIPSEVCGSGMRRIIQK